MDKIIDRGDLHKYRTELPNSVDDSELSVYAFRLYAHLKRVAGDNGKSWQSTKTLADACKMSTGSVSEAKVELCDAGFITIVKGDTKKGESDTVYIIDVWAENFTKYAPTPSPVEDPHSQDERPVHVVNPRIVNPLKKNLRTIPIGTDIESYGETHLFKRLNEIRRSKGMGALLRWSNVAQKQDFAVEENKRGRAGIEVAVDKVLRRGIADLPGIISYIQTIPVPVNHDTPPEKVYE